MRDGRQVSCLYPHEEVAGTGGVIVNEGEALASADASVTPGRYCDCEMDIAPT